MVKYARVSGVELLMMLPVRALYVIFVGYRTQIMLLLAMREALKDYVNGEIGSIE